MKRMHRRLLKLEATTKMKLTRTACSPEAIEQAALEKLSDNDRALIQSNKNGDLEHTPEYEDSLTRWEAALKEASREAGEIYFGTEERGWL